jgi:hypothetical protein
MKYGVNTPKENTDTTTFFQELNLEMEYPITSLTSILKMYVEL